MWDRWCKLDEDVVVLVRDLDMIPLSHIELFQRQGVFWVRDRADQIYDMHRIRKTNQVSRQRRKG